MPTAVFYADILGFSNFSREDGARRATGALSDIRSITKRSSDPDSHLHHGRWKSRYSLSDSLFFLSEDVEQACVDAARLFSSLCYYNCTMPDYAFLMRGGLAHGEVKEIKPIFPETAGKNLVGAAVVEAVELERTVGVKGPRLFISKNVVEELQRRSSEIRWTIDQLPGAPAELLWMLPESPSALELHKEFIIRECAAGIELFAQNAYAPKSAEHYTGYIDLVTRGIVRIKEKHPEIAEAIIRKLPLVKAIRGLNHLLDAKSITEFDVLMRTRQLIDPKGWTLG